MIISRQALNAYLDRDFKSYLWMKRLRKPALLAELAQFRTKPTFKTDPWMHQLVCFYIGICEPEFLFLLDMGLGKSKIISDLITYRQRERKLRHALVTVPNVINMASWRDDLAKHSDLEPWTCDVENIGEKWERLSQPRGDVTVIDYQGLQWALCDKVKRGKKHVLVPNQDRIERVQRLYNFVDMDESHKLKNHQSLWFDLLKPITEAADFTYATTGTVFGKNPEAMWSQFYLVDKGDTFGENLGLFRSAFFGQHSDHFAGTVWTFNKRTTPELNRMMQNRSIRYDEEEVPEIDLPKKVMNVIKLRMGEEQRQHYLRALQGLLDVQDTGDRSAMDAPWTRMRQILSGYLIWKDSTGQHKVMFKDNPKLQATERLAYEMGDAKLVICHYYTDTGKMLVDHFKGLGFGVEWLYGGTKDKQAVREAFMHQRRIQILVMNTDTGGTGNDGLQDVANYMAMYESPTQPDTRKQVEKRLHRPGQRKRTFFYDLVMRGGIDQGILDDIAEGRDLFESVVNGRRLRRLIMDV